MAEGRQAEPNLGLIDSQSVKATEYTPQRAPAVVDAAAVVAALTTPDAPAVAGVTVEQIAEAVLGPQHGVPDEQVPAVVAAAIMGVGEVPARPFPKARDRVGYDPGKKVKGRKRHLLVDTPGLVRSVVVHGADVPAAVGAALVLARRVGSDPRLAKILADMAYQGPLVEWVFELSGVTLEIVQRAEEARGFVVQKWRWIVERIHAWSGRFRRLSQCFERFAQTGEAMIHIAMIRLMVRRIAHPERETWQETTAFAAAA